MKRSPINRMSKRREAENRIRRSIAKRLIHERMVCEARISGCTIIPTDLHEIMTRARGGSITNEENILALCRNCHHFITVNPAWSLETGFVVHSWATPADLLAAERARTAFTYGTVSDD